MSGHVDIRDLHPSVQPLVRRALRKGWSARPRTTRTHSMSVELHAPPPHMHVMVIVPPITQWNDRALRTLDRKINRYS